MAAKHIEIAQTQGPKAGFNAYIETLERSGLNTAQASLAEIRSKGNKKAQFDFYCSKFGGKFGATPTKVDEGDDLQAQIRSLQARLAELQGQGIGVVAPVGVEDDDEDTSLDDVDDGWGVQDVVDEQGGKDAITAKLARMFGHAKPTEITMAEVAEVAKPKRTRSSKPKVTEKENLWRPWAVARFGIPTTVGGTFTYKSKRANKNTVHQVTRVTQDGVYAKRVK